MAPDMPGSEGRLESCRGPGRARVLHLITRLDAGGSASNTMTTCRLSAPYCGVVLAAGPSPNVSREESASLRRAAVRRVLVPHLRRRPGAIADCRALLEILKLFRRLRPDIVHTHTSKAGILGRLAARLCGTPIVIHTPHGHIFYGYFSGASLKFFVFLERLAAHWCDRIVSLTELETMDALAHGIGRAEQYVTIPSGVPLRRFMNADRTRRPALRAALRTPQEAVVFLCSARLVPVKGVDLLIDAWSRLPAPAPYLWIAGDGPERPALAAQVERLALTKTVRFLGWRNDLPQLMAAADAFVLASRNEGMGRVFVEAMAAGLPVIGTDVGGVREVIEDGVTGLLAPPGNPAALCAAVTRLAGDSELRRRLGEQARNRVFPKYDAGTMVRSLLSLYRELLKSRCGKAAE